MQAVKLLSKGFISDITYLFKRQISSFQIIFGRRGTGKTDLALLLSEILHKFLKFKVATNIKIYKSWFPIEPISSLQDLKYWGKHESGMKVYLFDEVGRSMPRRSPMARLNLKLINEFQIIRKYKLSFLCCTPSDKYVDKTALGSDILDGYFHKPFFNDPKVALYEDYLESFTKDFWDLPKTSVSYDTWDSAIFTEFSKHRATFNNEDKELLWKWVNGSTSKELGLDRTQIRRKVHKFIRETLEKERDE